MTKMCSGFGSAVAMLALAGLVGTGCEDGGADQAGEKAAFVGTWLVTKHDDPPTTSYYVFNQDGSFYKMRAGEGLNGDLHLSGTFSVDSGALKGNFTNPGVGTGEIVATIKNGIMEMDFIEHWHTPYKHVPCTGVKQ